MKILISGSHGFIGSAVYGTFQQQGHDVFRLIRPTQVAHKRDVFYDSQDGYIDHARIEGFDAVIHLAGENLFGRWSDAKKKKIYDSRVANTRFLCENLAQLNKKPATLLCASAIGYYGHRGEAPCDESAGPGDLFLSRTCVDWEAATEPAKQAGIRTLNLRFGVVLDAAGGSIAKMLGAFKTGMGGPLGDGTQWVSWVTLADAVSAVEFALNNSSLEGPVNVTSPKPVQNKDFTTALGKALHRPVFMRLPKTILKIMFGQLAEETLLCSAKVVPEKLIQAGFDFQHPNIAGAFEAIL